MRYRSAFTTVDSVVEQLELAQAADTVLSDSIQTLVETKYANARARIERVIYDVSRYIAQATGCTYVPYQHTYTVRLSTLQQQRALYLYDGNLTLSLSRFESPLLELDTLTWRGTVRASSEYALGDGLLMPAEYLTLDSHKQWSVIADSFDESAVFDGVWGYHTNPDAMWIASGITLDSALSDSVTTVTVSDTAPFATLGYIRIGDEYLQVSAIDTDTDTLTIARGTLGSTAVAHDSGDSLDTLQIDDSAEQAARRLAVVQYLNPSEMRRLAVLPDRTIELDSGDAIKLPPQRMNPRGV